MSAILELKGVSKSYGAAQVLKPTHLEVQDGEFLTLLGPSGSGKTTILRMIGGFLEPTSGEILYERQEIGRQPAHRRPFNTVFQDYALFPHMSVAENVGFGLRLRGNSKSEWLRAAEASLDLVGLSGLGGRKISQLSGGQKQRVALARALICQPRIVLLDEPLAALDADRRRQMQLFLKEIQRKVRTTFLFVTHDQEEAMTISDRIVLMDFGEIQQVGTPKELYYAPASAFAASFFGENNVIPGRTIDAGTVDTPVGPMRIEHPFSTPGDVVVAIRPEAVMLEAAADMTGLHVPCEVVDISFVGSITKVVARPDAAPGITILAKVTSDRTGQLPSVGQSLTLTLSTRHAAVVKAATR